MKSISNKAFKVTIGVALLLIVLFISSCSTSRPMTDINGNPRPCGGSPCSDNW